MLDTSVVVAVVDEGAHEHASVVEWLTEVDDDLVTTPLAVAEMDYFVAGRARALFWEDLDSGAYQVRWWADAMAETIELARRWSFLDIGLADASLIALARRLGTDRVATLDHRHFRQVTTAHGEPFVVLPADAPAP